MQSMVVLWAKIGQLYELEQLRLFMPNFLVHVRLLALAFLMKILRLLISFQNKLEITIVEPTNTIENLKLIINRIMLSKTFYLFVIKYSRKRKY
jgi:hypothetical protein